MSLREQKQRWFKQHPYCYWCGTKLVMPPKGRNKTFYPPNLATIDHLRPKGHKDRAEPNRFRLWRRVLACRKCNQKRDQQFTAERSLEELWRNSGQWARMLKLTGMLNEVAE